MDQVCMVSIGHTGSSAPPVSVDTWEALLLVCRYKCNENCFFSPKQSPLPQTCIGLSIKLELVFQVYYETETQSSLTEKLFCHLFQNIIKVCNYSGPSFSKHLKTVTIVTCLRVGGLTDGRMIIYFF